MRQRGTVMFGLPEPPVVMIARRQIALASIAGRDLSCVAATVLARHSGAALLRQAAQTLRR